MKNIFLLIILMMTSITADAQITITSAQLPYAGLGYLTAIDTSYTNAIPAGGAAQGWYLVNQFTQDDVDTIGWTLASSTPYAADFPTSNLASNSQTDSVYIYSTSNASGYYLDGVRYYGTAAPFGVSKVVFNPASLYLPVPFTYGDSQSSYTRFVIDVDTALPYVRLIHRVNQTYDGDGWGSLSLPNGTYPNTLRIKNVQTSYDSLLTDILGLGFYILVNSTASQNTNYYWVRQQQPALVLTINADSLGTTGISAEYLEGTSIAGTEELVSPKETNVSVYPNPATDLVTVQLPTPGTASSVFRLTDITGRVIRETSLEGMNRYGFYVNHLPQGVYTWTVDQSSGKLIVR